MTDSKTSGESPEDPKNRIKAARDKRNPQVERRLVTILFCDVAGSTLMAEQLDPEEWAKIMDDAFDLLKVFWRSAGPLIWPSNQPAGWGSRPGER